MIKPTNGRIVLFTPSNADSAGPVQHDKAAPLAAMVVHVWGDRCVNLTVFDSEGGTNAFTSVTLLQDDDARPAGYFCEWMDYQKGQAARTEAAEKANHVAQIQQI